MADFLGYMFFSSLEYLAFILLTFSIFTMRPERYKLTIAVITTTLTAISYLLTITQLYKILPIPIIITPVLALVLNRLFKDKFLYTLLVSIGGLVVYGLLQAGIIQLSIMSNLITFNDINTSFSPATYLIQFITALIGISIAIYVNYTHTGFGFSFYRSSNRLFIIVSMSLLTVCTLSYGLSIAYSSTSTFMIALTAMIVSTLLIMIMSKQQDIREFS